MVTYSEEVEDDNVLRTTTAHEPRASWQTWLIGRHLPTADAPDQTIGKAVGLAVFASDALSSTAYATQEILVVLAVAGTAAFGFALPISIAIVVLLAIVTLSYEQTIHAYPNGGGAYIVARDNLGEQPAQLAAAALLTDYILTVAVSVSAGVAQITSAFPAVYPWRVLIAVSFVAGITVLNLRGVKESGRAFAIPTYFFLAMMFGTVTVGLVRYFAGALGTVSVPPPMEAAGAMAPIGLFVLLHAFSNGTTALTGVEAISNGVQAFREPRSRNAGITLLVMTGILGTLFLGITFVAVHIGAVPSEAETVISQLARTVFDGRGVLYLTTMVATTLILVMAANTAFAGYPRLGALVAEDGYLPRQLTYRGSRLVYSRGIVSLAVIASLLIAAFGASVTALIPLYAVGVFVSFTLSQAGMARRWWKSGRLAPTDEIVERGSVVRPDPAWRRKLSFNAFGAFCTAVVACVFAITKFSHGAWIVLVLMPILMVAFAVIHRHYRSVARRLSLEAYGEPQRPRRQRVIIPVSGVHRGTMAALHYARALSDDVTAVHVSMDADEAERLQAKWAVWGDDVRLVIVESPYRLLIEPLLTYIDALDARRRTDEVITIVVPRFVPKKWWHNLLHANAAFWLRSALAFRRGIVITDVPYQLDD